MERGRGNGEGGRMEREGEGEWRERGIMEGEMEGEWREREGENGGREGERGGHNSENVLEKVSTLKLWSYTTTMSNWLEIKNCAILYKNVVRNRNGGREIGE
jgi:hypothetical protein